MKPSKPAKGVKRTCYYQIDSSSTGFPSRPAVNAQWESIRTLLLSGNIASASRLFDGRVTYFTSDGAFVV